MSPFTGVNPTATACERRDGGRRWQRGGRGRRRGRRSRRWSCRRSWTTRDAGRVVVSSARAGREDQRDARCRDPVPMCVHAFPRPARAVGAAQISARTTPVQHCRATCRIGRMRRCGRSESLRTRDVRGCGREFAMMVGRPHAGRADSPTHATALSGPGGRHRPAHLRYIRGIDGLRAISVLAVLVYHHYVVGGSSPGWLPGGFYGVEVFFVLSGYLITSLLLDERTRTGTHRAEGVLVPARPPPAARALPDARRRRPLLAAVPARQRDLRAEERRRRGARPTRRTGGRSSPTARTSRRRGRPELLRHLWSLAIEEQFYLFWPLSSRRAEEARARGVRRGR